MSLLYISNDRPSISYKYSLLSGPVGDSSTTHVGSLKVPSDHRRFDEEGLVPFLERIMGCRVVSSPTSTV